MVHVELVPVGIAAQCAMSLAALVDCVADGGRHEPALVYHDLHDGSVHQDRLALAPVLELQIRLLLEFDGEQLQGLGVVGDHSDFDLDLLALGLCLLLGLGEDDGRDLTGVHAISGVEARNLRVLFQILLDVLDLGCKTVEGLGLVGGDLVLHLLFVGPIKLLHVRVELAVILEPLVDFEAHRRLLLGDERGLLHQMGNALFNGRGVIKEGVVAVDLVDKDRQTS